MSKKNLSRRNFSKSLAATGAASVFGFQFVPSHVWGANSKLQLAGIGCGGKGNSDISGAVNAGMHVTALVDVVNTDIIRAGKNRRLKGVEKTRKAHRDAAFYTDYREMLADMGDKIDAVTIATPDHHHFHATAMAMQAGKHVYTQKPLTHGIWEARKLAELAAKSDVKTQMGNQAHANNHMRRVVELLQGGIIGKVTEIHNWTNRPIWPQGFTTAPNAETAPKGIDWEQWIGPAPYVDYSEKIAPFNWRGWWDYGTGALGDMACHIMDLPYWGAGLTNPTSVTATQEQGGTKLSPPINSTVVFDFGNEGVKLNWYDGQKGASFARDSWSLVKGDFNRPSDDILEGVDYNKFGSVVVGEKGKLFFNRAADDWFVTPGKNRPNKEDWPEPSLPRARGQNPYHEWVDAIHGKIDNAQSDFAHAGPFTEAILTGCIAQRNPGETLKWDSEKLAFTDRPDLDAMVKRDYREGWEISI